MWTYALTVIGIVAAASLLRRARQAGLKAKAWENAMRGRFKRDAPEA